MKDKVSKVFQILGVEPNERFLMSQNGQKQSNEEVYIDEHLNIHHAWMNTNCLCNFLNGEYGIIKIPQKTKRELFLEEMHSKEVTHYIDLCGVITRTDARYASAITQGNCGTKEKMKYLREKRQVEAEIKFMMKKYPDTEWDGKDKHWFIRYNNVKDSLEADYYYEWKVTEYCFPTEESCELMLELVTEERYKKYILGVE